MSTVATAETSASILIAAATPDTHKRCNTCSVVRAFAEFRTDPTLRSGLSARCRHCSNALQNKRQLEKRLAKRALNPKYKDKIRPDSQLLDADGRDWAWAFVIFKSIRDCPNYVASSDGNIWSFTGGIWRELKRRILQNGHPTVSVRDSRSYRTHLVSHLILETFVGPRPDNMECCHFPDRDPANCQITNIRWDTREGNIEDKFKHGTIPRGENHHAAKQTEDDIREIRRLSAAGMKQKDIAAQFNATPSSIHLITTRKQWAHVD